jgi:AcrR family transcriptional regulator
LLDAALAAFESDGYDAASVTAIARAAGVTTGALYHHFGSKAGLHAVLLADLERRLDERLQGAIEAGDGSRASLVRGLQIAFDAAVRAGCCRVVGEAGGRQRDDPIAATVGDALPDRSPLAAAAIAAAWRSILLGVAEGADPAAGRAALAGALAHD